MPAGILFGTEGGSGLLPLLRRMPPALPPDSKHRSGNSPPSNSSGRQLPGRQTPGQHTPVRQPPRPKSDTGRNQTPAEIRHRRSGKKFPARLAGRTGNRLNHT